VGDFSRSLTTTGDVALESLPEARDGGGESSLMRDEYLEYPLL
jgi:hypothetical protein